MCAYILLLNSPSGSVPWPKVSQGQVLSVLRSPRWHREVSARHWAPRAACRAEDRITHLSNSKWKVSLSRTAAVRLTRLRATVTGDQPCSWKGPWVSLWAFTLRLFPPHRGSLRPIHPLAHWNISFPSPTAPESWRLSEIWRLKSTPELLWPLTGGNKSWTLHTEKGGEICPLQCLHQGQTHCTQLAPCSPESCDPTSPETSPGTGGPGKTSSYLYAGLVNFFSSSELQVG